MRKNQTAKKLSVLILMFLTLNLAAQTLGDVNASGAVDIVDALLTAQYYVGLNPSGFNATVADVNLDSAVNIVDALLIAQYYVGLIAQFPGAVFTIEAENAYYDNATVETSYAGYSGSGYVDTTNTAGTYLEWTLNASVPGNAQLVFYYADGGTASRPMEVRNNGTTVISSLDFPITYAWDTWSTVSAQVYLYSGTNILRITALSSNGAPNLDKLQISFAGTITATTSTPAPTAAPTVSPTTVPSYNSVVAKDGSGNYSTVQNAINAAPDNGTSWYTIYIRNGSYHEIVTVGSTKTYLRLIGESSTGTILTYNYCASTAGSTSGSASTFIKANNFIAQNITFENAFDYNNSTETNKQAVAAEPQGDRQIYLNCRFTGYQDTLYVRTARQYFKSCFINGVVDFIFGDATAVFSQCEISSRARSSGCVSAPSTLSGTAYGIIFLNCTLTCESSVPSNSVWLGRPWHPSSGTGVSSNADYLNCSLGAHISTEGWTSMSGVSPSTERMAEYKNTGAGAVINSTRPQLTDAAAAGFTITNILKGSDNWNPETVLASLN
jgi:pectinesterase